MKNYSLNAPKSLYLIILLYITTLLITGTNYPVFRDELYYLDCANHPAFGYVDHPPVPIIILAIWKAVFGDSLISLRVIPALCGGILIFLTGLITHTIGGNKQAQIFSAISVACFPVFWVLNGFYSMNCIDLVIWAALFYLLIKLINTQNGKIWILFGIIAGIGLMNKISVGYLGAGLLAGIVFTSERKWFKNKYFWFAGAAVLIIFSPYIIWNIQNDFATREFISNVTKYKNVSSSPLDFLKEQLLLTNPLNVPVWALGIEAMVLNKKLNKYRAIAIAFIVIFLILSLNNGKPYYIAASYPVLISAGWVFITDFLSSKKIKVLLPVYSVVIIILMCLLSPAVIPVLPPEETSSYLKKIGVVPESGENLETGKLPQYFADRFGWEEMTEKTAKIYNLLPETEKQTTGIFAQNYGEAGAINYYGKKFGLPECNSGHNNHWIWGPRHDSLNTFIIIGGKEQNHRKYFDEVTKIDTHINDYAMPYENNLPVFLCRKIKKPIREIWPETKKYI